MEEEKLVCGNCGEETMRPPKPKPKNAKEARQVLFHCEGCGARNLRDGTAIPRTVKDQDDTEIIQQDKPTEKQNSGAGILALLGVLGVGITAYLLKRSKEKSAGASEKNSQESSGSIHDFLRPLS